MDDWYEEFQLSFEERVIECADELTQPNTDIKVFWDCYELDYRPLAEFIDSLQQMNDDHPISFCEDMRVDVSRTYDILRDYYEKLEQYEKCQLCIDLERQLRYQFLKLQTFYEAAQKQKEERQTRRMGLHKHKK